MTHIRYAPGPRNAPVQTTVRTNVGPWGPVTITRDRIPGTGTTVVHRDRWFGPDTTTLRQRIPGTPWVTRTPIYQAPPPPPPPPRPYYAPVPVPYPVPYPAPRYDPWVAAPPAPPYRYYDKW